MVPVMQKVRPANAEAQEETAEDFLFDDILVELQCYNFNEQIK